MPSKRATPFRPRSRAEISQAYNDGIVTVYNVTDGAVGGLKPQPVLTEKLKLCYQERKLGIKRFFDAKQNQIHAERVIRVQKAPTPINNQDAAQTEDGKYYRIDLVQAVPDVYPPSLDLTLAAYEQNAPAEPEPGEGAEQNDE